MNYSKDSRDSQSESQQSKTKKKKKKKRKTNTLRILLISFIIFIFAVVGAGLGIFVGIIKSAPDVSTLELKPTTNYTSFVYDADGAEIDRLSGGENRIYVKLNEIPKYLQHAVVATEDERFYEHNGIDMKGILRAVVVNIKNMSFSEGASTITQQLIKQNILTSEKKLTRKVQEQYLALQFEKIYPKEMILEYYLNTIPLGHGVNGVQAAANRYFNKNVSDLTLAESVVLSVITQRPTYYSPINHPENNKEKCKVVLQKMFEQGYITEAERDEALAANPYANIQKVHEDYIGQSSHSYFVDAVVEDVIADLQSEKGYTEPQANNLVYGGGLKIFTTLDQPMQKVVDSYISDSSLYPSQAYELKVSYSVSVKKADGTTISRGGDGILSSDNEEEIKAFKKSKLEDWGITAADKIEKETILKVPQPQAAFVIMDYHNGHVKALSGGRGDKEGDRVFNRATQAARQPGSTFKILAAYAPALDTGKLSPGSILIDEPYTLKTSTQPYSPKNWDLSFEGPTSVRRAIYRSMNVLAVKTGQMVGIDTAYDYLTNFGFTTLSDQDKYPSLPLGGLTKGVTPIELNAAYGAIANSGTYVAPILYTKVLDMEGNTIIDNTPKTHTVIKESTAFLLTDMMQEVIKNPEGTGRRLNSTFSSMPVAGKTGTTNDDRDLTFSAYTPYYVATIWSGHDNPKKIKYKHSYHLDIWGKIMNDIHKDLPYKAFPKVNTGLSQVSICTLSGKIATELCGKDPDNTIKSDYFTSENMPTEVCDIHAETKICKVSNKIATEYCPVETVESKIIRRQFTKDGNETLAGEVTPEQLCDVHGPNASPSPSASPGTEGENGDNSVPSNPDEAWPWPSASPSTSPENENNNGNNNSNNNGNGNGNGNGNNNGNGNGNNNGNGNKKPPKPPKPPKPTPIPPTKPSVDDDDEFFVPQG